jgi:glycine cleavage system aminomethyltransferase T
MSLEVEVSSLRSSVVLADEQRRSLLRLRGPDIDDVLDAVCPRPPFLHEGQVLETVFCDAQGDIVGDVLVARAEDALWLLVDGLSETEVTRYLTEHAPAGLSFSPEGLGSSHDLLSLHGPYAWELLSEVLSPEVIGLSPLGCYFFGELGCFRAGSVGEYAYQLLVPRSARTGLEQQLWEQGGEFDLRSAGRAALDVCRLENFVFNLHAEGNILRDPLTLQLAWRLSQTRAYPGAEAHRARRLAGLSHRAVLVASEHELRTGMRIEVDGEAVGEVLTSAPSPTRGDVLGIARLQLDHADPGLGPLLGEDADGRALPLRVLSAPALDNRSVHVSPQRHGYRTRKNDIFPSVVRAQ